jgi:hypothetical protein
MHATLATVSLFASLATGALAATDAPVISDNPAGASYMAEFSGEVNGEIVFTTHPGGKGVDVAVSLNGFANEPGPFVYHIHQNAVPADGNCNGTEAHLDPENFGEQPPCDASKPDTCQIGDLAGKHGKIPGQNSTSNPSESFSAQYTDLYISTLPGTPEFLGGRAVVIHKGDFAKTRMVCANITTVKASGTSGSASPSGTAGAGTSGNSTNGTQPTAPASPPTQSHSSASSFGVSALVSIVAVALGMAMSL